MAYTQAQLDALESALANGATTVSFEGKSVTYRSLDDIQRAIAVVKRAMGLSGTSQRFSLATTRKG